MTDIPALIERLTELQAKADEAPPESKDDLFKYVIRTNVARFNIAASINAGLELVDLLPTIIEALQSRTGDSQMDNSELPYLAGYVEQLGKPETLEQAIGERDAWVETAAMFSRNDDYYRGLVDQIGEMFGDDAKTADDGSMSQGILRAKVPELVAAALQSRTPPQPGEEEVERGTAQEAWQDLVEKDDRTSPEDYPDMALITFDELADYMSAAMNPRQRG